MHLGVFYKRHRFHILHNGIRSRIDLGKNADLFLILAASLSLKSLLVVVSLLLAIAWCLCEFFHLGVGHFFYLCLRV